MTDVHRDLIDWIMNGVGIISAVISVIAIVLALRANRHAKDAEARSREMIVMERRRAFDLEILRDLLAALDDDATRVAITTTPARIRRRFDARLSMLPNDLSFWRSSIDQTIHTLIDLYASQLPQGEAERYETQRSRGNVPQPGPELIRLFSEALRADVIEAVERRMRDDQLSNP